jgi:hypothetical protein
MTFNEPTNVRITGPGTVTVNGVPLVPLESIVTNHDDMYHQGYGDGQHAAIKFVVDALTSLEAIADDKHRSTLTAVVEYVKAKAELELF